MYTAWKTCFNLLLKVWFCVPVRHAEGMCAEHGCSIQRYTNSLQNIHWLAHSLKDLLDLFLKLLRLWYAGGFFRSFFCSDIKIKPRSVYPDCVLSNDRHFHFNQSFGNLFIIDRPQAVVWCNQSVSYQCFWKRVFSLAA